MSGPYYFVQPGPGGRWHVAYRTSDGVVRSALDCPDERTAEEECCWMNWRREREVAA